MSLESDIQELTVAVRALTHAIQANPFGGNSTAATLSEDPPLPPANDDEAKAQRDAEKAGNDSPKPSTTTDTSPPSSNESRTVTYDDVKNVTIAVSKIDKAKAVAGLARFGVTTAKALNEEQWLDYVVYTERVAKGEIDPEASHE